MIRDDKNAVSINGKPVGEGSKAFISYSPDKVVYNAGRKVSSLIDMYELMYDDFNRAGAESMLTELGIDKGDVVGKLSKGNAEKLQIILTMSRKAGLFILDEPFNGVDPVAKENMIRIMLKNIPENASVLLSTHQIGDIEQILDEAVFIKDGRIILHRSVDELRDETGRSLTEKYMEEFR